MLRVTGTIAATTVGVFASMAAAHASQGPGAGPGSGNSIVLGVGAIILAAMLALIGWHRYKSAASQSAGSPPSPLT